MNLQTATIEEICSHRSEIAAYIDGELSPVEELELDLHLAMCQSCAAELSEQKKLLRVLDFALEDKSEIELPENFTRVVVANAESRVSGLRRPQERFRALFVCAALFLFALLGLGGETQTIFGTLAKFADKFFAVAGFALNLIYDIGLGAAVILRSLSHQFVFNPAVSLAVVVSVFLVLLFALSRFGARSDRS